jgi:SAM-dependent methyltransferase
MAESAYFNPDALLRYSNNAWLVSNPRLRTHVEVDPATIGVISAFAGGRDTQQWCQALKDCRGWDRTAAYCGEYGLHADHSGLNQERKSPSKGNDLFDLLRKRYLLVASPLESRAALAPLANLLDREHLGNFHQRVGQHVLLEKRIREPWRAWQDQKFSPDGRELLPGNYQHVQERFFDDYFGKQTLAATIVDFGCGNGYFSAKFASMGARVVALDSSSELLDIAQANHKGDPLLEFHLTRTIGDACDLLDSLPAGSCRLVYLQDTLLLLLFPESGRPSLEIPRLLSSFRRVLGADGRLCAMEPNPVFWLAGRYGDPEFPYAIVTEYRRPNFNVAPTLDRVLPVLASAGFALVEYRHPEPTDSTHADYAYIAEYPIWDFYAFSPVGR